MKNKYFFDKYTTCGSHAICGICENTWEKEYKCKECKNTYYLMINSWTKFLYSKDKEEELETITFCNKCLLKFKKLIPNRKDVEIFEFIKSKIKNKERIKIKKRIS